MKRKVLVSSKLTCKFYDPSETDWSDAGCETSIEYNKYARATDVNCSSDHLASFAVLMTLTSEQNNGEEEASDILLAISLLCLILTIAAILPNKKIMKMQPTKVKLMFVLALIFSIICFFLMDIFVGDEPSISCSIIAFSLNYFWLCQISWMVIEAVTMYMALVKVPSKHISGTMFTYSLVGWLLPLIFPVVGFAWGGSQFADPKTCFVRRPYGFVSFYGPMVIGVAFNWIIFFFVARVILESSKAETKQTNIRMRSKQLRSALIVSTVLGLGWITGFFLLMNDSNYSEISKAVRWLFIAVNAPQGLYIFLFYALLKEENRRFWLSKIRSQWQPLACRRTDHDVTGADIQETDEIVELKPGSSLQKEYSEDEEFSR